jgi:hypothetical protein
MFRAAVLAGACVVFSVVTASSQESEAPPLDLRPSLEIGAVASSNSDRAGGGVGADIGLRLAPSVEIQSNWARHALRAQMRSELVYFAGSDEVATSDVLAAGDLRLDVRRHTQADFSAAYNMSGNRFDQNATDETLAGSAALTQDLGAVVLRGALAVRQENPTSSSDYVEVRSSLRSTFAPTRPLQPFIEAGYAPRFHSDDALDSEGLDIAAGLAFDHSPFMTGEIAGRWLQRNYDVASIGTVDAFGVTGRVAWTPTDFTEVSLGAGLDIDDTAGGAARIWSAELRAEHGVSERFGVFAGIEFEAQDGLGGTDYAVGSELGLRWTFNRYMGLLLAYQNEFSFGGGLSENFDEHRVSASLLLTR